MAIGTSPRVKRMLVQYWSGSAWTNLADSSGLSRVLNLSITDSLDNPRMSTITLFNPRTSSSSIFQTGDFDTVIKNKMKIRLVDQTTFTILFLGQVENIVPENTLKGYTLTITAYDSLIELTQNILKKDSLNDGDRSNSPAVLNNDFVSEDIDELIDYGSYNQGTGNRSIEVVNTTDSDDAGAHRFQKSLGKTNTRDKDFSDSGANFLNTVKRLAELESGIEATASAKITGGLKPYNFYVDTNFQTTATDTEGSGNFFNYFPSGCMPAAAQSGTSYTLANPADDGLTLMFGTGGSITETGQTLKLLPSFSFEDLARERVTHLTAHFIDPISGYSKDVEFEVFNYKSISSGAGLQDSYEPSGTDTGGTETGKTLSQVGNSVHDAASGGNLVGHLQYISNVSGAGFALLTGTTGTNGAIRHTVAAGETLHVRNAGASVIGTFTLSDTTDPNGSDIFRPQEVFKQKILKNFSINTGDLVTFRRAVAAAFENKDTRRVRASFSLASGYPYHFVEGQVNSAAGNTITDSTIANQHATTTDGLAAANIDSFPTAGIRTGMVLHKLTGEGGTMVEYGYIEKTEDNSLTADLTNSASFSTNDYYRTYIPLRAGHTVQIKNTAINASLFNHVVTSITYEEGEQGFMTYLETVGDIGNPKALNTGVRNKASTAPIKYDDETYSESVPFGEKSFTFSGTFAPGDVSDNNLDTAVQFSAGSLFVDDTEYTIAADDSEDATTGVNGAMASDTNYAIYFEPTVSATKFLFKTEADFENLSITDAGGSGNAATQSQNNLRIRVGTARKNPDSNGEAGFELGANVTMGTDFKFLGDSIAANAIKANNILSIGSDATSGIRFKFATPTNAPAGAGTHFFRGYTSNSGADDTGYWFNFDAHSQSIQVTDGASGTPTTIIELDSGGIDIKDGSESTSFLNFFKSSTNIMKMFAISATHNSSTVNFQMFFPTDNAVFQMGSGGAFVLQPHVSNANTSLGTNSKGWSKFYTANIFSTEANLQINSPLDLKGADGVARSLITSDGNLTIDAQGSDDDIIFKGTDGGSDITMLTLDASEAGDATFNDDVFAGGDFRAANGTAAQPAHSFSGDDNTGVFRYIADYTGISGGGTVAAVFGNSSVFSNSAYSWINDGDTFITATGNVISFTTGNSLRVQMSSTGILSEEGSNSAPGYSFVADPDTGIYNTANTLNMAFGGTARVHFGNAAFGTIDADIFTVGDIECNGDLKHGGSIISSDIAYKSDIVDIPYGLDIIDKLKPKEYTADYDNKRHIGLIAQDVKKLLPDLDVASGKEGTLGLRYEELTAILIKSIQELKEEIRELKENK